MLKMNLRSFPVNFCAFTFILLGIGFTRKTNASQGKKIV